jgi:hypothetical protein
VFFIFFEKNFYFFLRLQHVCAKEKALNNLRKIILDQGTPQNLIFTEGFFDEIFFETWLRYFSDGF